MPIFLLIKDGIVINAIVAESADKCPIMKDCTIGICETSCASCTSYEIVDESTTNGAWIGWTYNGSTFSPPV